MHILLYILLSIILIIIFIGIIGWLLPKQRIVSKTSILNAPLKEIYNVLINNDDWKYRSDLKDLVIIERNGDKEIWDEISKNGNVVRFSTKEKIPYSFYSFEMTSKIFTGYWTAELKEFEGTKTQITATEYVEIKNPLIKVLSYIFFDLGKYMETYQQDLKRHIRL